jgi:hypothetical protein
MSDIHQSIGSPVSLWHAILLLFGICAALVLPPRVGSWLVIGIALAILTGVARWMLKAPVANPASSQGFTPQAQSSAWRPNVWHLLLFVLFGWFLCWVADTMYPGLIL